MSRPSAWGWTARPSEEISVARLRNMGPVWAQSAAPDQSGKAVVLSRHQLGQPVEVLADRAFDEPAHELRSRPGVADRYLRGVAEQLDAIRDAPALHRPADEVHVQQVV